MGTTTERVEWLLTARDSATSVFKSTETSLGRLQSQYERFSGLVGTFAGGLLVQQMARAVTEAEQASVRLDAVLNATRRSAGLTRGELEKMNDTLVAISTFDDESIREAQATLLKFGTIQKDVFERALKASADYAAFLGTGVADGAQALGKALQSPTEGVMMLERQVGKLTFSQKENIKTLTESGRFWEAQAAVLDIVESKVGGTAEKMNSGFVGATRSVTKSWDELMETMGKLPKVVAPLQGMASLLTDMRLTLEGIRNPYQDLILNMTEFMGKVPGFHQWILEWSRVQVTRSSVTGDIRNPGADAAATAQSAAVARLQAQWDAAMERASAGEKVYLKLLKDLDAQLMEVTGAKKDMTAVDRLVFELQHMETEQLKKLSEGQVVDLLNRAAQVEVMEKQARVNKAAIEYSEQMIRRQEEMDRVVTDFNQTQSEALKNLEFETRLLQIEAPLASGGLMTRAEELKLLAQVNAEREIAVGLRQIDLALEKALLALGPETNADYEERAKKLRDIADAQKAALPDAVRGRQSARLTNELVRAEVDEFNRLWSTVEDTGREVFVRVFSDGKNAFEGIGRAIKASVIDLLYQLTAKKWFLSIQADVAGSMGVGGGGSGGSGMLGLGSLYNAGSGLYNFATGGSGLMSGGAAYAAAVPGLSSFGAGSQAAMLAAQTGEFGAAGLSATASAAGSAGAASAVSAIAAAAPYAIAAFAAYSLLKGNGGTPSYALGDTTGSAARMGSQYASLLSGFGGTGSASFFYGANTGRDSQNPNFAISSWMGGKPLFQVGEDNGGLQRLTPENLALQESRAIITALQSSELPGYLKTFFDSLAPAQMDKSALDSAVAFAQQLKSISRQLDDMGMTAASASDGLITLLGSLGNAPDLLSQYYQNFISDGERTANTWRLIDEQLAKLGADSLPKTRAEFRALVEAQDLSTDAGQRMYAGLLQLAPAFASVTDALTETVTVAEQLQNVAGAAASAVDKQIQATQAAANSARQSADSYRNIAASLTEAVQRIMGGGGVGAAGRFDALFTTAMQGDTGALGGLPSAAADFLEASRSSARTQIEYARDRARVVDMLDRAGLTATGMANWQDYQSTLLQTQANALEQIKEQLASPSPDAVILQEQADLLTTISGLLQEQTIQIVQGNSVQALLTRDQTGQLGGYLDATAAAIAGNNSAEAGAVRDAIAILRATTSDGLISAAEAAPTRAALAQLQSSTGSLLTQSVSVEQQAALDAADHAARLMQTTSGVAGAVHDQTGKVITGNATQDAIRNITAVNNSLSEEMLRQLVTGSSVQNGTLQSVLDGAAQTVALLQQLVDLTAQQVAETEAAKAARIDAYNAEIEASRKAVEQQAAADAEAAAKTATSVVTSIAPTLDEYVRSRGYYLTTGDDGSVSASSIEDGLLGPGTRREVAQALMDEYATRFPGHATGLDYVPYDNYLFRAHQGEAVLNAREASMWRRDGSAESNKSLIAEIRALRAEVAALKTPLNGTAASTRSMSNILSRVTRDGESVVTTTGA